MLKRLLSAISTAHAISLAIREAPDAIMECVEFARGNAELREELNRANRTLTQYNEKRVKEITSEFTLNKQVSNWRDWACGFTGTNGTDAEMRATVETEVQKVINHWTGVCNEWRDKYESAQKELDATNGELSMVSARLTETEVAYNSASNEMDGLKSKLARHEEAERWHQVTAGEGELPPEGVSVIYQYNHPSSPIGARVIGEPGNSGTYRWRYLSSEDVPQ